jgi:ketosteroid isomerase-like protein
MMKNIGSKHIAEENLKAVQYLFAITPLFGESWWHHAKTMVDTESLEVIQADSLPYGGTWKGLMAFQQLVSSLPEHWENLNLDSFQFTAGEDLVTISFQFDATSKKTGKNLSMPFIEVWRFKDRKLVSIRPFYWDTHKVVDVLGCE